MEIPVRDMFQGQYSIQQALWTKQIGKRGGARFSELLLGGFNMVVSTSSYLMPFNPTDL
jgi:hypothetical protein